MYSGVVVRVTKPRGKMKSPADAGAKETVLALPMPRLDVPVKRLKILKRRSRQVKLQNATEVPFCDCMGYLDALARARCRDVDVRPPTAL